MAAKNRSPASGRSCNRAEKHLEKRDGGKKKENQPQKRELSSSSTPCRQRSQPSSYVGREWAYQLFILYKPSTFTQPIFNAKVNTHLYDNCDGRISSKVHRDCCRSLEINTTIFISWDKYQVFDRKEMLAPGHKTCQKLFSSPIASMIAASLPRTT